MFVFSPAMWIFRSCQALIKMQQLYAGKWPNLAWAKWWTRFYLMAALWPATGNRMRRGARKRQVGESDLPLFREINLKYGFSRTFCRNAGFTAHHSILFPSQTYGRQRSIWVQSSDYFSRAKSTAAFTSCLPAPSPFKESSTSV